MEEKIRQKLVELLDAFQEEVEKDIKEESKTSDSDELTDEKCKEIDKEYDELSIKLKCMILPMLSKTPSVNVKLLIGAAISYCCMIGLGKNAQRQVFDCVFDEINEKYKKISMNILKKDWEK